MNVEYRESTFRNRIRIRDRENMGLSCDVVRWDDALEASAYLILHDSLCDQRLTTYKTLREYIHILQQVLRDVTWDSIVYYNKYTCGDNSTLITSNLYEMLGRQYRLSLTPYSIVRIYACTYLDGVLSIFDSSSTENTMFRSMTIYYAFKGKRKIRFFCSESVPENFVIIDGQYFGRNYGFEDWVPLFSQKKNCGCIPKLSENWTQLNGLVAFSEISPLDMSRRTLFGNKQTTG